MATEATLDGLYKNTYAKAGIQDLIPRNLSVQQDVSFTTAEERLGLQFNQPVVLTDEAGATYNTNTISGAALQSTAFALNDAIGGVMQNATVTGSEIVLRSWLSYQQAARATSGGASAFTSATELGFRNNMNSIRKRVELSCLHGGSGAAAGGLGTTQSSANVNATSTNVTITAATWASGIWSGLSGTKLNFYDNAVLVSTGADAIFTLTTVTASTRVLLITGTATGITALDAAIAADPTQVKIFFQGAYAEEMTGLIEIARNTVTLFGISASTYDLWKGNDKTLSGAPTMGKFLGGLADAVGRGLDVDGKLLVNPVTWNDMMTDQAAMRVYDSSWKRSEMENGAEGVTFYSQNGKVEVKPHIFIKGGQALFYAPDECSRVGSVDVTYEQPGRGGRIFFDIPAFAGYEFRSYTDQAIFCRKPATLVYFSGFVNAT